MKKLFAVMSILCATYALRASTDYYVMFSVFSPGQIPVAKSSIDGVCLNLLYGEVIALLQGVDDRFVEVLDT